MKSKKSGSTSRTLILGGVLFLAMLIITTIGIYGAAFLYTRSGLASLWKPYPIYLFGVLNLVPGFWIPVPNYGYSILREFISDLGVGPSSFIFNMSMIIAGVLTIAAFPTLLKPLGSTETAKTGVAIGIVAGINLICVGIFPETTGSLHVLFATIFFTSMFIAIGILSYANNLTMFFSNYIKQLGYFSFLFGLVCTFLIPVLGPFPEWILIFLVLIWVLPLSIEMLAKRKSL